MMDARKQQTPKHEQPQRTKGWKPQSRIAPYIKGNAKLEDIVNHNKLVKPEHRHNRRAFMALVNDEDNVAIATIKPKIKNEPHQSTISRCPSNSTRTSTTLSLSRGGRSLLHHQRLTTDDLTRTIVEKNEYITVLREQLDALRGCVRVDTLLKAGTEQEERHEEKQEEQQQQQEQHLQHRKSLHRVLDCMLECLLDMVTNLKHHDEHDERMAQFVSAVERERENVLRSVEALCQSNAHKDSELRQMSGEQTELRDQLQRLQQDLESLQTTSEHRQQAYDTVASDAKGTHAHNEELFQRLHQYECKYECAAGELRRLSEPTERICAHTAAEKKAFDELAVKSKTKSEKPTKTLEKLRLTCQSLGLQKHAADKRLAEAEKRYESEIERIHEAHETSVYQLRSQITELERDVQQMRFVETKLQAENEQLKTQLLEAQEEKLIITDEIAQLRLEKEMLEKALAQEENDKHGVPQDITEKLETTTSSVSPDTHWDELKKCLFKTVVKAGLIQDDDIR